MCSFLTNFYTIQSREGNTNNTNTEPPTMMTTKQTNKIGRYKRLWRVSVPRAFGKVVSGLQEGPEAWEEDQWHIDRNNDALDVWRWFPTKSMASLLWEYNQEWRRLKSKRQLAKKPHGKEDRSRTMKISRRARERLQWVGCLPHMQLTLIWSLAFYMTLQELPGEIIPQFRARS